MRKYFNVYFTIFAYNLNDKFIKSKHNFFAITLASGIIFFRITRDAMAFFI